jgi:hypothetical protein
MSRMVCDTLQIVLSELCGEYIHIPLGCIQKPMPTDIEKIETQMRGYLSFFD